MDANLSARDRANAAQRAASDPAVSAFVSASAGSGKTKLLTDRLLRLMLGGADPARIQCLTYTRAAAAEMALRLQSVLGEWVTLPDAALDLRLRALDVIPTDDARARARALFARVLDLPGGMRVGTIHAFCQSLLRRFPLEARISPHFQLIEDAQADAARRDAEEQVLGDRRDALADTADRAGAIEAGRAALSRIAGLAALLQFDKLVRAMLDDRERLTALLARPLDAIVAAQRAALGATRTESEILAQAVSWPHEPDVRAALRVIGDEGPPARTKPMAEERLRWLEGDPGARRAGWAAYAASFVAQDGEPYSYKTLVGQTLAGRQPALRGTMEAEQARVIGLAEGLRAAQVAEISASLLTLALPIARAYAAGKERAIRLDYADLIDRTTALLRRPEDAAWVLFKLDGGLDHLLLDEVQDTAPAQWAIAGALTAEFFAGVGARDTPRTVFAVGDRKQSIFSFQGADPEAFDLWRGRLEAQVRGAGQGWREIGLDVSFRSAAPVLDLVDAVFADGQTVDGVGTTKHQSDRIGQAGAVELWPLVAKTPKEEPPPWGPPRRRTRAKSAPQLLAERLADWIARETAGDAPLPSRGRPLAPGDVLILLRRRNDFGRALVRCLKQRGVAVAGLDRMTLTSQPAVADLLALCDTLLLPQDDLSLACVLTSPLGGLTDDSLMALAAERTERHLWDALRRRAPERPDWEAAHAMLAALFARVDYATPHALLAEALGAGGGRARLLGRLGPEAAEPIDELLAAALAYARAEPPSLQGFLHWVRRSAAEIRREPHGQGDLVRIMTVHGAKGLQAPLVILPDTTAVPQDDGPLMWAGSDAGFEVPVWSPVKELRCEAVRTLRAAAAARRMQEQNRLLYVALTRAEDRLVVCGHETHRAMSDACWYRQVERGFAGLRELPARVADEGGERLVHACPQAGAPDREAAAAPAASGAKLPAWAGSAPEWAPLPPAAEPPLPQRLAPSRPADAQFGPAPQAASPLLAAGGAEARFRRGKVLHALLQHLPDIPQGGRAAAAERFVMRPGSGLAPDEIAPALADVLAVLGDPALAALFGPGSRAEAPLTGRIGDAVVGGLVDRIAVLPGRVLVADYKTARTPPARPEDVPVLYLRQMAAYRAVLRLAFPDRPVDCLLVWTTGARVMTLPHPLLDSHAPEPRTD